MRRCSALLVLSMWLLGSARAADVFSVDVERFRPAMDTHGYAMTQSSTTLGHLEVGVGFWANYSEDSVVMLWDGARVIGDDPDRDGVIDRRSAANLQFGLGLTGRLSFTFDAPVVLWQEGIALEHLVDGTADADLVSSGLGDVRGQLKFVLADIDELPIGLALVARASVPTGQPISFLGEGDPTFTPMIVIEAADASVRQREYMFRVAFNAGLLVRQPARFRELSVGNEFVYAGALAVRPSEWTELGGEISGSYGGPAAAQQAMELGPFMRLHATKDITLTMGGNVGMLRGVGTPDYRLFVGGTISPSLDPRSLDRDKDGIVNRRDACINIPEDLDGWQDLDGCPEDDNDQDGILDVVDECPNAAEDVDGYLDQDGCPDLDNDGDGIADDVDQCPDEAENFNDWQDEDGCPEDDKDTDGDGLPDKIDRCVMQPEDFDGWEDEDGCPDIDNDRDGFLDPVDSCPNLPETVNGWHDDDGCPDSTSDSDGDGLLDEVDRCPDQPEDFDGWEDEDGCPDPDNDQDSILDVVDDCPNKPETMNGFLDEDGCPDERPTRVRVERTRIIIDEQVYFDVNSANIQRRSDPLLEEIAQILIDHPEVQHVRVEGHTDSDGESLYNLRLSQARAEAVVDAMIDRGVDRDRLEAAGLGENNPIADNRDQLGKSRNRRVEFHITEREDER